jgi:hypothetical protein
MKKPFLLFTTILFFLSVSSQENNYWSTQYGAKSNLLGGASVATFVDDGAIFYNPAALAFKDSSHISVAASAFQFEMTKVKNGMGTDLDLHDINYDVAPQLVGGNLKISKKVEAEFILLSRYIVNANLLSVQKSDVLLRLNDTATLCRFTGEFESRNKVQEQWAGAAISYRLTKNIGIGLTNFVAYRFQKSLQGNNTTAVPVNSQQFYIMKFDFSRGLSYYTVRNILKAGFSYTGKKLAAGCAFTFPSIHLMGQGTADNYFYLANLPDNNFVGFNQYNKGENVQVTYKSPWSVSSGLKFNLGRLKVYLSAEYFAKLSWYDLYTPQPGTSVIPGPMGIMHKPDTSFSIRKGANAVTNFAAGTELKITSQIALLAGFRSDFTSRTYDFNSINDNMLSETGFNIWHSSLGFYYIQNKTTITSGVCWSYGQSGIRPQPVNFADPTNDTYLLGRPVTSGQFIYNRLSLIVGFTF